MVKHDHVPKETTKFLGQPQSKYEKKNWSSVMLFNNEKCQALTADYVNTATGLELHRFQWLESDDLIGDIPHRWTPAGACPREGGGGGDDSFWTEDALDFKFFLTTKAQRKSLNHGEGDSSGIYRSSFLSSFFVSWRLSGSFFYLSRNAPSSSPTRPITSAHSPALICRNRRTDGYQGLSSPSAIHTHKGNVFSSTHVGTPIAPET